MNGAVDASGRGSAFDRSRATVEVVLSALDLTWGETEPGLYTVSLPGTHKLRTECALQVGRYGLGLRAFVARQPDENHAGVYRWLLQRNLKLRTACFSLDAIGDIYLTGTLAGDAVTEDALDRLLGEVAQTSDSAFDVILELGFATSIRREWAWRRSRGEPTANLAAFRHLDPGSPPSTAE